MPLDFTNYGSTGSPVLTNAPAGTTAGPLGKPAALFNGTSNFVRVPQALAGGTEFTVMAYVRSDTTGTEQRVVTGAISDSGACKVGKLANGQWGVGAGDVIGGFANGAAGELGESDGQWFHLTAVFDPDFNSEVYINGVQAVSTSDNFVYSGSSSTNTDIGRRTDASGLHFNGGIAHIGIFFGLEANQTQIDSVVDQTTDDDVRSAMETLGASASSHTILTMIDVPNPVSVVRRLIQDKMVL